MSTKSQDNSLKCKGEIVDGDLTGLIFTEVPGTPLSKIRCEVWGPGDDHPRRVFEERGPVSMAKESFSKKLHKLRQL